MKTNGKVTVREKQSTRQLIGINAIGEHSLLTPHGELVLFSVKPANLSTLSDTSVSARIYALMTVLKGVAEIELLCLNSKEDFEANKRYMRARLDAENLPAVRNLLERDMSHLDRIQAQTATAREFLIVIRMKDEKDSGAYLARVEKNLSDQGFTVRRSDSADLRRLLGVYFEQNVTTERFEDFDGERWVILND